MLQYQFRPIDVWPGTKTSRPVSSRFKAGWTATLDLLERELKHLAARDIVIQAFVHLSQVRNDGMLRADAKPFQHGVILAFQSKHGPLKYPCDSYDYWQDNVRAIALALEALRTVDRYGVTKRAEQYRGWTALPPPEGVISAPGPVATMTKDEAIRFLAEICEYNAERIAAAILRNPGDADVFVRQAAAKTHPDRGGDPEKFKKVMRAKAVLEGSN